MKAFRCTHSDHDNDFRDTVLLCSEYFFVCPDSSLINTHSRAAAADWVAMLIGR